MSDAAAVQTSPREPALRLAVPFSLRRMLEYGALLGIWLGLLLLFGALSKNFLSAQNLGSLANRIPTLAVVSAGMTLVLIIGGIDLSVGSLMGFCGALIGLAMVNWHWPLWAAALLCLAAGTAGGALNGSISVAFNIPSFIVTLGMLEAARGLAYSVTNSQTKYIGEAVVGVSKPISWVALSPAFLIALAVIIAGQLVLSFTVFGRRLVAIGSNEQAARFSGINPQPARIMVFAILGFLTGLGALFYTSRLGSSDPNAGIGLELSAIAAVVIGGTSLSGGRGSMINSFFGALIIATLEAGLAQVGASEPAKRIITGAVIIIAVVLDSWRHQGPGSLFGSLKRLFSR
jgi:ribose transport system permease protein